MGVLISLALRQLRHRPARPALLCAGVALALALPVIASGTGAIVSAETLRRTVDRLDPGSRGILITDGNSAADRAVESTLDRGVRAKLSSLSSAPVRTELVYHQLSTNGATFFLAAVDDLASGVRLVSGRLPSSCTPSRCEVVLLGDGDQGTLTSAAATLGVVVVGHAVRTDPLIVAGSFDTGGVPILLGASPDDLGRLDSLALFARTTAWVVALDVDRVLALGVPAYVRRSTIVLNQIVALGLGMGTYAPDDVLVTANARAQRSGQRFGLLGGSAAVLLLGFAFVAAVGLRREHTLLVAVLRRRGTRWPDIARLTCYEAAVMCGVGAALGIAVGLASCAWLAARDHLPVGRTLQLAVTGATGGAFLLTVAAAGLTVGVLLWPDTERRTAWRTTDLVALAGLGAAVLAVSRGSVSSSSLADRADPLLVTLPVLGCVTTGLLAARVWGPLALLVERGLPRRFVAGRLALLGAVRRPLRAVATVAFLAAAVSSVVFAGAYRATLLAGAQDQAAYAVPLDATLHSSRAVVNPLLVTTPARLEALAPGITAYGLTRSSGVVRTGNGDSAGLPVLGIDPASLVEIRRWSRTTGSSTSPAELAKSLTRSTDTPRELTLPAGTRTLGITVSGDLANIELALWVSTADGLERGATLSGSGAVRNAALPALGPGPLRVVAITVRETPDYATHHQHAIGEGNTDQPDLTGTIHLGAASANGVPITWTWNGWGSGLATATLTNNVAAPGLDLGYRLAGELVVVQPGFVRPGAAASADSALPVIVDPATARTASRGLLTVSLGQSKVTARVVGVLPRFPTTSGRFVLADQHALSHLLDAQQPGTGEVNELWAAAKSAKSRAALTLALSKEPTNAATISLRAPEAASLAADPVARGSRLLLALAGVLALLVAVASIALLVVGDRRDSAGELFSWEANGLRPSSLRRVLLTGALSVVGVGVPLGVIGGLILARVGATLIAVDASGATPHPPLALTAGPLWTSLTVAIALGVGIALAAVVAASALRERLPVRPEADLR